MMVDRGNGGRRSPRCGGIIGKASLKPARVDHELQAMLAARVAAGRPVRVGLIGPGNSARCFLAQVPSIAGRRVAAIADLDRSAPKAACRTRRLGAALIARTRFTDAGRDAIHDERVEVVIEATAIPAAGIRACA